jgi:hypothetical protein
MARLLTQFSDVLTMEVVTDLIDYFIKDVIEDGLAGSPSDEDLQVYLDLLSNVMKFL